MDTVHWRELRAAFEAAVEVPEAMRGGFVASLRLAPVVREELVAMLAADARNQRASAGDPGARLQRLLRAIAGFAEPGAPCATCDAAAERDAGVDRDAEEAADSAGSDGQRPPR